MSEPENKCEFRQPVEVFTEEGWRPGVVEEVRDDPERPVYVWYSRGNNTKHGYWFPCAGVRPDPDFALVSKHTAPPARTGWRLPEPGDVVRIVLRDTELRVASVNWALQCPIQTDDGERWYVQDCVPVRLHDAPAVAAKPETAKHAYDASVDGVDLRQLMQQIIDSALAHPADNATLHRFALQTVRLLLAEVKVREVSS